MDSPKFSTGKKIIEKIKQEGYEALFVGGAVRDYILERPVEDIDIATNMPISMVEALFPRTIPVGKSFGVVLVIEDAHPFQVAQFRVDEDYKDKRHPEGVKFVPSFDEDARRRDFTINALGMSIEGEILDPIKGLKDLKKGLIRSIGNPWKRMEEDYLRMLRAVRLSIQLNFSIEKETKKAIKDMAFLISKVSMERIKLEMDKILLSPSRVKGIRELYELGLLAQILPELFNVQCSRFKVNNIEHQTSNIEHTITIMKYLPCRGRACPASTLHTAWALLIHCIEERDARERIARRLKFTKKERKKVQWLLSHYPLIGKLKDMSLAKIKRFIAEKDFNQLVQLYKAHEPGQFPKYLMEFIEENKEKAVKEVKEMNLISGYNLIEMGFKSGPTFRTILERVQDEVLEGRLRSREEALDFVRKNYKDDYTD